MNSKKLTLKDTKVIAIDPDMRKSGVAYIAENGTIIDLDSLGACDIGVMVRRFRDEALFAIEDVSKHGAVYEKNRKGGRGVQSRIAQNVGMVKAAGTMITDIIENETGTPPIIASVGIGKQVKHNAKLFNELTGWRGRSNEDTRDAASIGRWVVSELRSGKHVDPNSGQLVYPGKK